ncbi:Transposon TX1 uncharacterized protein [Glycine soja]
MKSPSDVTRDPRVAYNRSLHTSPFTEVEIKEVMWDCDGNKSLGLDGYTFKFIKHFWDILKGDFCMVLREFHANGKIPRGTNASFIALIPKKLKSTRSISLIGCIYKIIPKVLSKRMRRILDKVIDERQLTFMGEEIFLMGEKWITWMRCCVESITTSFLVNGSPTKEFSVEKRDLQERRKQRKSSKHWSSWIGREFVAKISYDLEL